MGRAIIYLLMFVLIVGFSFADVFSPAESRYIQTAQNDDWAYIQVHRADNTNSYIGINKTNFLEIGFADDDEFYGKMWMVSAYEVGGNYYLCPLTDIDSLDSVTQLDNGWIAELSDPAITCYQYNNHGNSVNVGMNINYSMQTLPNAKTKINVTTTIDGYNPTNTGFAFLFFPENPEKYRYIDTNSGIYDLAGVDGSIPVDKTFEFLDGSQSAMGDFFDWTDMLDTGNRYSEILTIGGQKAFMVGTYGYGASRTITIDPLYQVDYSPNPAVQLVYGNVEEDSDSLFTIQNPVTTALSDNVSSTKVEATNKEKFFYELFYEDWSDGKDGWYTETINDGTAVIVSSANSTDYIDNETLRLQGSDVGGDDDVWVTKKINLSNRTNVSLTYDRWCQSLEGGENLSTQISLDNISYSTIASINNDALQTVTYNISDTYWNDTIYLRFRLYSDYINDECFIDNIYLEGLKTNPNTTSIFGTWSETYDEDFDWFLVMKKETTGSHKVTVRAYNNSDDISEHFVQDDIFGTGEFNINVSSLLDYMSNNKSLTFTKLRFYANDTMYVSEIALRKETNDTTDPNISDCQTTLTDFGCLESINFSCNITDNVGIDEVFFEINGSNVSAEKSGDLYFVQYQPTSNSTITYSWTHVYAEDVVGNKNNQTVSINSTYSCIFEDYINITHNPATDQLGITNISAIIVWDTSSDSDSFVEYGNTSDNLSLSAYNPLLVKEHSIPLTDLVGSTTYYYRITSQVNPSQTLGIFNFTTSSLLCDENWVLQNTSCLTNDSRLIYYLDSQSCGTYTELPVDNGTYVACDYCSEDLEQQVGVCLWNGSAYTQEVSYTDNNYYSCCVFTSLPSDCSILYSPYNTTTNQTCNELDSDFVVELDENVYFGINLESEEKVFGKIYLNDSEQYSCISYVKTPEGKLIQSNPVYEQATQNTISLFNKRYEDREYFMTSNGLATVYWTKENLIIDGSTYVFGVECSSNSSHKISEKAVTVLYEGVNSPVTRWVWLKENLFGITTGVFIIILLGLALFFIYRVITR